MADIQASPIFNSVISVEVSENNSADTNINSSAIEVQSSGVSQVANLSDILDVDTTNLNNNTSNYVLSYDPTTQKYKFINPDEVVASSAGVSTSGNNPSPAGFTPETINYLDIALDNRIDMDAGEF
jgi:hypothetical protein